MQNDKLFNYLVATDQVDEFCRLKDEYKSKKDIEREIDETKTHIKRLKEQGIYTDWQKKDLKYNEQRLKELDKELQKKSK
jgi:cell fate (sporulation/competence/biofilm development) regulator YmcA (YheA/YmcA/DUF963 family)